MAKFLNDTGLTRLVALIKQAINGKADKTELPLVVNFTESNNVVSCDTSIADIYAAYSAGREVFGRFSAEGQLNLTLCLPNLVTFSNAFGNSIAQVMGFVEDNTDTWTNNPVTLQTVLTFDSTPTLGSSRPVTSEGIKVALNAKQDTLTFDNTPTANSSNPVKSSGIYTAINTKSPMMVEFTTVNDVITCDTSIADIYAAYSAGREIYGHADGGQVTLFLCSQVGVAFYFLYSTSLGYIVGSVNGSSDEWSNPTYTLQEQLVSGTNIKTVNNNSLLGSGDVHFDGGNLVYSGNETYELVAGETIDQNLDRIDVLIHDLGTYRWSRWSRWCRRRFAWRDCFGSNNW